MSLCGRLGPVFPSSAVQTGRYPGTRMSVDPVYKVARSGARVEEMRWRDRTVIDGILGIGVCKNTLDVSISSYTKVRTRQTFRCGDSDGRLSHIKELIAWRTHFHASGRRFTHNSSGQSKNPLTAITVSTATVARSYRCSAARRPRGRSRRRRG